MLIPAALFPKNVKGIHLQPRDLFGKNGRTTFLDRGRISKSYEKKMSRILAKNGGGF